MGGQRRLINSNMDNNTIEVTGISTHLLELIDERVRQTGDDRASYVRELIENDIFGGSERLQQSKVFQVKKPLNPEQWEVDMRALTEGAEEIPVLPPRAFTRESIYRNHN